jgi:hypothetical protein
VTGAIIITIHSMKNKLILSLYFGKSLFIPWRIFTPRLGTTDVVDASSINAI